MRFKEKLNKLIPSYAYIPIILLLLATCLAFYATRPFNKSYYHYDLTTVADDIMPFTPFFIIFYILAFAQWFFVYLATAKHSRSLCYEIFSSEITAKIIGAIFFLVLPTTIARPEITGNDVFSQLTSFIYSADTPDNLFPSFHCLDSWICFRAWLKMKKFQDKPAVARTVNVLHLLFTLAVFVSTVFVKQHFFIDIIGGVAVAEIGLLFGWLFKKTAIFKRITKIDSESSIK